MSEELPTLRIVTDDSATALPVDPVITPTTAAGAAAACEVIPIISITAQTGITEDSRDDFERLDGIVREGLSTFIEVGHALAEIRARELWRVGGYSNWGAYCQEVGGLTKSHGNRLIKSSEVAGHLRQVTPIGVTPRTESQVRPLCRLESPKQQTIAWTRAVEAAGGIQPTAKLVTSVTNEMLEGEKPKAKNTPTRREKLISIYQCLLDAIRESRPKNELESHMAELGNALGIESPSPPQAKTRTPRATVSN